MHCCRVPGVCSAAAGSGLAQLYLCLWQDGLPVLMQPQGFSMVCSTGFAVCPGCPCCPHLGGTLWGKGDNAVLPVPTLPFLVTLAMLFSWLSSVGCRP